MKTVRFIPDGAPRVPKNRDFIKQEDGGFWRVNIPTAGCIPVQQCYIHIEEDVFDPEPAAYLFRRTGEERNPVRGEYWEGKDFPERIYDDSLSSPRHILTRTVLTEGWEERLTEEIVRSVMSGPDPMPYLTSCIVKALRGL